MSADVSNAWFPANNGSGKRMWFVMRPESVPIAERYHDGRDGRLVRYVRRQTAQRAADRLNALEVQ